MMFGRWQADWVFFILFAGLFVLAEQSSPMEPVSPEDLTVERQIETREGNLTRRGAYVGLAVATAAMLYLRRKRDVVLKPAFLYSLSALLAWTAASALWSDEPLLLFRRLLVLGIVLVWARACAVRWTTPTTVSFVAFSTFANLLFCFATEIAHGRFAPFDRDYRLGGTLLPNELAQNCMILALAAVALMVSTPKGRRWLGFVALVSVGCLLLTKSRTAMIGLATGFAVYGYFLLQPRAKMLILTSAGALILTCSLVWGDDIRRTVLQSDSHLWEEIESLSGRIPLWRQCVTYYVRERPALGFGYATFWTPARITAISDEEHWGVAAAHSAYLEILLELGAAGLALYAFVVVAALAGAHDRGRNSCEFLFLVSILAATLVIGLTESQLPIRSSPVWFYILLAFFLAGTTDSVPPKTIGRRWSVDGVALLGREVPLLRENQ